MEHRGFGVRVPARVKGPVRVETIGDTAHRGTFLETCLSCGAAHARTHAHTHARAHTTCDAVMKPVGPKLYRCRVNSEHRDMVKIETCRLSIMYGVTAPTVLKPVLVSLGVALAVC